MHCRLYIFILLTGLLCSCTGIKEAQQTIAVADSLRVNEGVTCDDSLALAEAYFTLGRWRLVYPNAYARACYYYGRALRNRNDQVAAMRAFISGTHAPYVQRVVPLPWFTDYHILGRIYSNIGTMCHLAGEYPLSYDMYMHASEQFLMSNDSIAYYYALNDMAFVTAMQNKSDETFDILNRIEHDCSSPNILTKTWETKAILYRNIELYDSAICAAEELYTRGYYAATGYVVEAQSYWSLQQYDSALYYANVVMEHPHATEQDRFNMLYILTYDDSAESQEEIKQRSEERADIDKEILDPLHEQLAKAIEVLKFSQDTKSYFVNWFLFVVSLCIVAFITWFARLKIQHYHKQSIDAINTKHLELLHDINAQRTALYAETEYERKKQFDLRQQHKKLEKQNNTMHAEYAARRDVFIQEIENHCIAIRNSENWENELSWKHYNLLCKVIDTNFNLLAQKLKATQKLDEKEIRLCILVLLDKYRNDEIARLIHYGKGIRTYKSRVNAKLGNKGKDLRTLLVNMAISYPLPSCDL